MIYDEIFNNQFDLNEVKEPLNLKDVTDMLILHPDLTSKNWVAQQLNPNLDLENISDAGIYQIEGTEKAIALATAGNVKFLEADPEKGAMIAVAEALRKLVCSGARPTLISVDLNFGNAKDEHVKEKFKLALHGLKYAADTLGLSIGSNDLVFDQRKAISGNALTVAASGILDNIRTQIDMPFKQKGDLIFVIGKGQNDISCSDYLTTYHSVQSAPAPYLDLENEKHTHDALRDLIASGIVKSCHSITNGGLFMALFEKCMAFELGFDITLPIEFRRDAFLFGESQSRAVITIGEQDMDLLLDLMQKEKAPVLMLGHVTKGEMRIDNESYGFIDEVKGDYDIALATILNS